MSEQVLTIGHSTHPIDHFLALLADHRVAALVDIRRFPSSRKFPHFNQKPLATTLESAGIDYYWFEELGGRRHSSKENSPNLGLENESFRSYADYMLTKKFTDAIGRLRDIARKKRVAIMCAEAVFWRCHRRLVSDYLVASGVIVEHIMPNGELRPHTLTRGAVMRERCVVYPTDKSLFDGLAQVPKAAT